MKRLMIVPAAIFAMAAVTVGMEAQDMSGPLSIQTADAQQMGKRGWRPQQRNPSMAAQFEHAERQAEAGAARQYVYNDTTTYTYSSTSQSIGNLNEITQILSEGSTGTVHQNTDQASHGNQGSAANTEVAIDSTTTTSSSADSNIGWRGFFHEDDDDNG